MSNDTMEPEPSIHSDNRRIAGVLALVLAEIKTVDTANQMMQTQMNATIAIQNVYIALANAWNAQLNNDCGNWGNNSQAIFNTDEKMAESEEQPLGNLSNSMQQAAASIAQNTQSTLMSVSSIISVLDALVGFLNR